MRNEHLLIAKETWKQMMPIPSHLKAIMFKEDKETGAITCRDFAEGVVNVCLVLVRRRYGNGVEEDSIELFQIDETGWGDVTDEYRLVPREGI